MRPRATRANDQSMLSIERALRISSYLAIATVLGMLSLFLATGVGQDPLQFVHSPDEYLHILLRAPATLRACLGLDNLFVAFYETAFVAMAVLARRAGANALLVNVALGALVALGVLDLVENMHFLVMLARAEQGAAPSVTEIALQVFESAVKFHVSYVGVFLFAFAIPRTTAQGRALAHLSWFVQLPVGVLIYVVPHVVAVPLVFVRFAYFVSALALAPGALGPRDSSDSGARVSSPGTRQAVAG
jgi:hypothetical protein